MALQLIVRIIDTPLDMVNSPFEQIWQQGQVEWGVLDTVTQSVTSKMIGNWPQLKEFAARHTGSQGFTKTVVLVPGLDVLLTAVNLPGRRAKHLKQALPFLLEEQLASDIEDNFFAVGAKISNAQGYPVAVVCRVKMAVWTRLVTESGLNADLLTSDVLLVPKPEAGWAVLVGRELAWLRTDVMNGLCLDRHALPFVLEAAVQCRDASPEEKVCIDWLEGEAAASEEVSRGEVDANSLLERQRLDVALDQLSEGQVRISEPRLERGLLESFSRTLLQPNFEKGTINLLQGPYQVRRGGLDLGFKVRPLILLLVLWLGLVISDDVSRTYALQEQSAALKEQSVRLFQSYFPNEKGSVRLRQRMENYLRSSGAGASQQTAFLDLLAEAGAVLQTVNGQLAGEKIALQRLSYDSKQSDLRIDIQAPDFASLEKFKSSLEANALQVDISSAVAKGAAVEGRIKVFR